MGRTKEDAPKTYSLRVTEHAFQNIDNITGYIAYIRHEPLNAIRIGEVLRIYLLKMWLQYKTKNSP